MNRYASDFSDKECLCDVLTCFCFWYTNNCQRKFDWRLKDNCIAFFTSEYLGGCWLSRRNRPLLTCSWIHRKDFIVDEPTNGKLFEIFTILFFSFKGDANLHDVFDSNDGYQIRTALKYLNLLTFFEKVWRRHWCWSFSTETGMRKQNIWKVPDGCHVDHFMTLR